MSAVARPPRKAGLGFLHQRCHTQSRAEVGRERLTVINSDLVVGASRQGSQRRITGGLGNGLRVLVDSTHAATVVTGSYYLESGRLEVFVEITDARTGRVLLDLGPLRGPSTPPDSVLAQARDSVVAFMRSRH